jgi:diguanylate cyclase (GGDEF)-like protein
MSRLALLVRLVVAVGVGLPLASMLALYAAITDQNSHMAAGALASVAVVASALMVVAAYAAYREGLQQAERDARELERYRRELQILYRVLRQVSAIVDPIEIRDLILSVLIEGLGADSCHLLLLEPHLSEGVLCSMSRGDEHVRVTRDQLTALLGPDVDPFTVPAGAQELCQAARFAQPAPGQATCWLPIVIQEQRIGIVCLLRDGPPLVEEELELFRTLAGGLAMAVENARLYELAITDSLTGLYVKRYFDERLRQECARAARYGTDLSLLMLDLDRFKEINDQCGHQAGDEMLRSVGHAIAASTRDSDTPCRWGGDEFAVILPETGPDAAEKTADRIREAIAAIQLPQEMACLPTTVSIGVASHPVEAPDLAQLVELADQALYEAKRRGRNRVVRAADSLRALRERAVHSEPPA